MSGVSRFRVTAGNVLSRLPPPRGTNQRTVAIAITPIAAAAMTPLLCCLILPAIYSALDADRVEDALVCRPNLALPDAETYPGPLPESSAVPFPSTRGPPLLLSDIDPRGS